MKNNKIYILEDSSDIILYPHFLDNKEQLNTLKQLTEEVDWQQYPIKLFGKTYMQPRLIGWYGVPGIQYKYSRRTYTTQAWTPTLKTLCDKINAFCNTDFNSVLANLYRNGQDSMGWHSDDEPELGKSPVIASLSLGTTRKFQFRLKADKKQKITQNLEGGSLLIMSGNTQEHWQHQIPKQQKITLPRINLTFRKVYQ